MTKVRKGSIADKVIRVCDWLDNSKIGNSIAVSVTGIAFCALFVYGLHCTHPF